MRMSQGEIESFTDNDGEEFVSECEEGKECLKPRGCYVERALFECTNICSVIG